MMKAFRTVVVAVILGAMFSPSISLAKTESRTPPVAAQQIRETALTLASTASAKASEAAQYAQREQQSQDLQNFKGGAVYLYFGSGVVLALIIILLILL